MEQGALRHERLLRVVAALAAPIVQLWGWPGCDRRAFLDRLLADDTTGWLAVADLADPSGLEVRLEELGAAEDALRSFLLEDPLEEWVYVSMMRVYAGRGRRDLVNRQYERLRSVLSTELGVEPSADTLAVYNELMV